MSSVLLALPTLDGRAYPETLLTVIEATNLLGRQFHMLRASSTGVSRVRNEIMDMLARRNPDARTVRVLWVDSDIQLNMPFARPLADAITAAETGGFGWAANYRRGNGQNVCMAENGRPYTDDELRAMAEWAPIPYAGLGLAYLDMPLGYRFHEGADGSGEDANLFRDTGMDLRLCRSLGPVHMKQVAMVGPRTWEGGAQAG